MRHSRDTRASISRCCCWPSGLMLLVSSDNLLMMIFISLETVEHLALRASRFCQGSLASSEAALKCFLFGGMSAAFTLFGISLIYGIAGDLQLSGIETRLRGHPVEPVFYAALVMTLVGFAFKLAAAPFHLWAPDVYEGAPTPVASFIASGSKVGSFFVLARILLSAFPAERGTSSIGNCLPGWAPVLMVLAALSMVAGSVAPSYREREAFAGLFGHRAFWLRVAGAAGRPASRAFRAALLHDHVCVHRCGCFCSGKRGGKQRTKSFAGGICRTKPARASPIVLHVGFHVVVGGHSAFVRFFGKFYLFTAAAEALPKLGLLWLVVLAVAASAVSLYYYLKVLKQIYAVAQAPGSAWPRPALSASVAIVALAAIVIVLGCVPDLLLGKISELLKSAVLNLLISSESRANWLGVCFQCGDALLLYCQ